MRIYLDVCCFNRPFDDQGQIRVKLEAEAKLDIQNGIAEGKYDLVWSYILDFENQVNPFAERKAAIQKWKRRAVKDISETAEILHEAERIERKGIKAKDALHISCAVAGGCKYFLTTDDDILKVLSKYDKISVISPLDFIVRSE
jgi:predicted nucleic acid-binding protein